MKTITICLIFALAGMACADTKLEILHGVSTTTHEVSPLPLRSRETLIAGREPASDEQAQVLTSYGLSWTATLPDQRPEDKRGASGMLTLRVWDPIFKNFPGWNSPIVEIFSGTTRLKWQELTEVGWAIDVWSASHNKASFLYVRTKHRHRFAEGENVYELNPDGLKLEHKGVYFSKDDLVQENTEVQTALIQRSKPSGEPGGADQPATKTAEKAPIKDQPKPPAPEDGPR